MALWGKLGKPLFWAGWVVALLLTWQTQAHHPVWKPIQWPKIYPASQSQALYHEQLIPNAGQASSHSASLATLPNGDLIAFWFAGSREGGKDVQIFQSYFRQHEQVWTEPQGIMNTKQLGDALGRYIGKLGNPLVFVDKQQKIWLVFVSVSYGGWAGSSLNIMFSEDLGKSWGVPRRLITSPFKNISTLVRNAMFALEDGSVIVPVYHEFAAQFPELLRLSAQGEVIEKVRMAGHGGGIQPSLVQGKHRQVYAFMRSGSHATARKVLRLKSKDEGQHWSDLAQTELPNPNAAQIVFQVDKKLWLWVGNHNPENRQDLTLAVSHDLDKPWRVVYQFEKGKAGEAFSYPAFTQDQQGMWHLLYTYNRKNIKHVRFNRVWLDAVMQRATQ